MPKQRSRAAKPHFKKKIAPVIVTVVLIAYYVFLFAYLFPLVSGFIRVLTCVLPVVFAGFILFGCWERIKEINGGEEDDLSQY